MARFRVRYLTKRPRDDGSARYFWQPSKPLAAQGWKLTRLSDDKETAIKEAEKINASVDEWRAGILKEPTTDRPGTLDALISAYKNGHDYQKLADRSRKDYDRYIEKLSYWAGEKPADMITTSMVQTLYEENKDKNHRGADYLIQVLRIIFNAGIKQTLVKHNPAEKPGLDYKAATQGHPWSRDALELIVRTALQEGQKPIAGACMLNYWIVQRPADILCLKGCNMKKNILEFTQNKTGVNISIPISALPEEATAHINLKANDNEPLIGRNYTVDRFQKVFRRIRTHARKNAQGSLKQEMEMLQFRSLRHTGITLMTEAECTDKQLAAISGHNIQGQGSLPTYIVRKRQLAGKAIQKRRAYEGV